MISFAPLFDTLHTQKKSKTDLQKGTGLSKTTIAKLSRDESVTFPVLNKICEYLNCPIDAVIRYVPDEPKKEE